MPIFAKKRHFGGDSLDTPCHGSQGDYEFFARGCFCNNENNVFCEEGQKNMADKENNKGDSPRRDFYGALNRMLRNYDGLEQEEVPLTEYLHSEFVAYFIKKIKELFEKKEMTPFSIARIPFEMAVESSISKSKKEQNEKYIKELLSQYRENTTDSIYERLTSLKKLEEGSRIYDFEDRVKYPSWNGWLPSNWKMFPKEWEEHKEEFENIGMEFEFTYSVARFYHLCEEQKKLEPEKGVCLEYFFNLKRDAKIHEQINDDVVLLNLKKYLTNDFSENLSIEKLQNNIKYFSPYYLTDLEMNTFFKWSICLCSKKPNLPFFKEIWSLGKLYHVNVFPLDFFDNAGSKINTPLLLKIRALKENLLKNDIIFPPTIKTINENWKSAFVWFVRCPFEKIVPAICNLYQFDSQYEENEDTENKDIINQNKAIIEKAKSKVHPYLDWIDPDLDRSTDKSHHIFATVMKALRLYSSNPKLYTNLLSKNKEQFFSYLKDIFKNNGGNVESLSLFAHLKNVDDSLYSYIYILIGTIERIFYPVAFPLKATPEFLLRLKLFRDYINSPSTCQILEFRLNAIVGKIFSHSKIICFATTYDFQRKLSFLPELSTVVSEIIEPCFGIEKGNGSDEKQEGPEGARVLSEMQKIILEMKGKTQT